jgi:hypothetical protein
MQRAVTSLVLLAGAVLGGCSNGYNLHYAADPQPAGANLFADYTPLQDGVGVTVDTDGRRLEEIYVKKADGTVARPLNITYPRFEKSATIGTGIGLGFGSVGVGTGVGVPVGPERARGLTTATFGAGALGEPPWELHIKVEGIREAVVPALGKASGK